MSLEGELVVRVASREGRVTGAEVRCDRPRAASRLMPGRDAREAPALAGALYAICGRSQAIAAQCAIEAIRGEPPRESERRSRERRIAAETLDEHAWRLLLDLPVLAGAEPASAALAAGRLATSAYAAARAPRDIESAAAAVALWSEVSLLGVPAEDFLRECTIESLARWLRAARTPAADACAALLADDASLGPCGVAPLPAAHARWIAPALAPAIDADATFDERPVLDGAARETGALAREEGHPLVAAAIDAWGRGFGARLVARLVETARLVASLHAAGTSRHGAAITDEGRSIAWVETARGLLVHRVALEGERIGSYRVVAPTEWNFHPEGAFAQGVRTIAAEDLAAIEARVRRLIASLDPCVPVRCEVGHA